MVFLSDYAHELNFEAQGYYSLKDGAHELNADVQKRRAQVNPQTKIFVYIYKHAYTYIYIYIWV